MLPAFLEVEFAAAEDRQVGHLEKVAWSGDEKIGQAALTETLPDVLRRRLMKRQVQHDDALALLGVGDGGDDGDVARCY